MGKNIVYPKLTFNTFVDEPILKKLALFFDQIYIDEGGLRTLSNLDSKNLDKSNQALIYEKAVWDFLRAFLVLIQL